MTTRLKLPIRGNNLTNMFRQQLAWHRKRQDAYAEVIRESLGKDDDSEPGSEMDQIEGDSDEGDEQPSLD